MRRTIATMTLASMILGSGAPGATLQRGFQSPPAGQQQVAVPGFDPALGQLRCVDVDYTQAWTWEGCVLASSPPPVPPIGPPALGACRSLALTSKSEIGYFDAVGFVSVVGDTDSSQVFTRCVDRLPYPGSYNFASVVSQSASRSLLTSPQQRDRFIVPNGGTTLLYYRQSRGSQSVSHQPGSPQMGFGICPVYGVCCESYSAVAVVGLTYHFTPATPCPGDLNSDGVVDFLDLNGVLGSYSETGPCARGDLNHDSVVDFLDLNEILGFYGVACATADAPRPAPSLTPPPAASTR